MPVGSAVVMMEPRGSQAVDRALTILELFDDDRPSWSATEVAAALGVHRTTASRLLAALAGRRLVQQQASTRYVLGLGLVSLARQALGRLAVRDVGRDIVRSLRDETGEHAYLGMLDGDEIVFIEQASSPHALLQIDWVGRRQPLAASASGVVLLAHQESQVIAELLREGREHGYRTARLLSPEALAAVRRSGRLACYDDPLDDHAVVVTPVRDPAGKVVAALCVGASRLRVTEQRFWDDLVPCTERAGASVSAALGDCDGC